MLQVARERNPCASDSRGGTRSGAAPPEIAVRRYLNLPQDDACRPGSRPIVG